ncbi:MAG: DNA alkylation repair protein [Flavitalea sp.]
MEPLKNLYSKAFFKDLNSHIQKVVPGFDEKGFMKAIHDRNWEQEELKQRIRHVGNALHAFLPGNFKKQAKAIATISKNLIRSGAKENSFPFICLPDFIEVAGLDDFETSLDTMEIVTQFISCEFAIRPFLLKDPELVMKRMLGWSKHENYHVRRFSSEGCRPRLPWGKAIPAFKKDPSAILPILENLRDDESEFVRKSVANNINDIAKDHPSIVLQLIQNWKGKSKRTDWILKHGSRTLLRKADPEIYRHFGLSGSHDCELENFKTDTKKVLPGGELNLGFGLKNRSKAEQLFRVELGVYYVKSSGGVSRKLFKITERIVDSGETVTFKRKLSFKDLTTRKHYPGRHRIVVVVNGVETGATEITLLK